MGRIRLLIEWSKICVISVMEIKPLGRIEIRFCSYYHKATSSALALNFKHMTCLTNLAPEDDESLVAFELPVFEHLLSLCIGTSVLSFPRGFLWISRWLLRDMFNDFINKGRNLLLIRKYITGFTTVEVLANKTATTVALTGKYVTSP
jgi:hypothetical protein